MKGKREDATVATSRYHLCEENNIPVSVGIPSTAMAIVTTTVITTTTAARITSSVGHVYEVSKDVLRVSGQL